MSIYASEREQADLIPLLLAIDDGKSQQSAQYPQFRAAFPILLVLPSHISCRRAGGRYTAQGAVRATPTGS
jgi:hypothetical protein